MKTVICSHFSFFLNSWSTDLVYKEGVEEGLKYAGEKSFRTVTGMLLEQQSLST